MRDQIEQLGLLLLLCCLFLAGSPASALAQQPTAESDPPKIDSFGRIHAEPHWRLTYYFTRPTSTAIEHALAGLPTLDGEFVAVHRQVGDSVAQIIARVRDRTWKQNAEVVAQVPGENTPRVFFGTLQEYLRGDQRFRILAVPAYCYGCEGDRRVIFLPYSDTTGYLVGGGREFR